MADFWNNLIKLGAGKSADASWTDEPPPHGRLDRRLSRIVPPAPPASATLAIRAADCAPWQASPYKGQGLSAADCTPLIEAIARAGGNTAPVLVRANPPEALLPYELLVGRRRAFAVDWLNHNGRPEIRLNAAIVTMSDEEAFRLTEAENHPREDITDLQRAHGYDAAVQRFYAGVQSRMAEALGVSNSQLSRYLALTQLPDAIIAAFPTPDDVRVRHSEILTPLLRRPVKRERLIKAAALISAEQQALAARKDSMIPAATVLARLRQAATSLSDSPDLPRAIELQGHRIGTLRAGSKGDISMELSISPKLPVEDLLQHLREIITQYRDGSNMV